MSKAEDYRKRAEKLDLRIKNSSRKADRIKLERKQRALHQMAGNEDWLEGKTNTGVPDVKK